MSIHIENEYGTNIDFDYEVLSKKAIEASLDYLSCPYEVEVNILLTSDDEIQLINKEQRNLDKATDVLSFPMLPYSAGFDYDDLEKHMELFNPESGELLLGDIVLSIHRVKEQANSYNHSVEREFSFLIVHSMLHLFGHDHMEEDKRIVMEEEQKNIMNLIGISRFT